MMMMMMMIDNIRISFRQPELRKYQWHTATELTLSYPLASAAGHRIGT